QTYRLSLHDALPILPDGRRFIYLAMSTLAGESSIRVGSLDGGAGKVLLEADTSALYAPRLLGRADALVFVSGDALLAQRFDAERDRKSTRLNSSHVK